MVDPPESPPSYDQVAPGTAEEGPHPAIRFSSVAMEREEASRYGEGARMLREQTRQDGRTEGDTDGDDNDSIDELLSDGEENSDIRRQMEQFDIEEPSNNTTSPSDGATSRTRQALSRATVVSSRLARSINSKIISPVQKLIDPVAQVWNNANQRFDDLLARFGNPLMFRRLIYLLVVAFSVFVVVSTGMLNTVDQGFYPGQYHDHSKIKSFLANSITSSYIRDRLEYMSSISHMAGTAGDLTLAGYMRDEFESFGVLNPVVFEELETYLTFPNENESSMQLVLKDGKSDRIKSNLYEDDMYNHPTKAQKQPRPFHAFSPAGEAEGPVIFANYGTKQDYEDIGQDVKGAIVFVKYGKMSPGLKVMLAEQKGAKAVVMFNDKSNTHKEWPEGPDYPSGAVQRANVAVAPISAGDILTPGWPSMGSDRVLPYDMVKNVPTIPSIPVSWKVAAPYLEALKGIGKRIDGDGASRTSSGSDHKTRDNDQELWSGDIKNSPKAYLKNDPVVKDRHLIWNVFGKIEGIEQPQKSIFIGAQRDSFCYGAAEPMSSSAVLIELARAFSKLSRETGWSPLRSIYFASWDASEHNFAGSTEWVEYNVQSLRGEAVAYINLDKITGPDFKMTGHPSFEGIMQSILQQVNEPVHNHSMADTSWPTDKAIPALINDDGDQLAFSTHAGVPSLSIGFEGLSFPKHSCFDSIEWMKKYGDPNFEHHSVLANIAALTILKYADEPIIDFNVAAFGGRLHDYIKDVKAYAKHNDISINTDKLQKSADSLVDAGVKYSGWVRDWTGIAVDGEPPILQMHRMNWNSRMTVLNKRMLDREGLPDRNFYKHVVFGPQIWHPTDTGFEWQTFPAIRDAIEKGDAKSAQKQVDRAANLISYAVQGIMA